MNGLIAILLPLGSGIVVAALMIGLGTLFLELGHTGTSLAGLAIIVLVPLAGWLVTRGGGSESESGG